MKRREIVSKIFGIALVFVMVGAMLVPVHAGGEVTPNMNQASANNTTSITTSKVSTTPILGETKTVTIIPSENVTKPYRKFGNKTVNVVPAENVTKPSRKSVNKTVTVVLSEEITESKEPKGKAVTIIPSEDVSEPEKLESSSYDIEAAVNYAEAWWNGRNTDYYHDYGDYDCANFVSQCLKAGGLDLSAGPGVDAWGCIPSVSNLDYNLRYYQNTQYQVGGSEPLWLVKGDVVLFYSNDGTHRHSAFGVVGDASNYWHGNAHSINCYHKPLSWFLSDPNLDYCVYFHIKDGTVVCPYSCWDRSALSGDALAALVRSHFPLGGVPQTGESMRVTAYAVAKAESGGNPSACGDSDRSIGLWQINMDAHPTYDECLLFEKDYNANAAVQISSSGTNWNPWCTWEKSACGGNGNEAYKQYLTEARKHFYPKVTSLSVSQTSINLGDTVTIYYSVSDDVGLSRVELWRTTDKSGVPDESNWAGIKETSILGTAYSGYFTDTPTASGIYWYGIHVVDNSGAPEAWNCEKNSRTGNWPGVYGPDKVVVTAPQRTITFYTDPTAGGTITFTGSTYSNGQSTTKTDGPYSVSANPASGYVFDHWTTTGGVSVSNANSQSTTATVSGTGSIKAWFTQPQRTITFYTDPTAGGTITFDGSTYSNGQSTTKPDGTYPVSANPGSGYVFDHWTTSGGVSVSNANSQSTTATVTGTGSIKAWFTQPMRTITFYTDPTAGGTITFAGSTYSNGQSTTKTDGTYPVSANPGSGYVFDHWTTSGGVSVSNANSQSTTATVTGTGSIKAWFTQPMRTITFYTDPTAGGTITFDGSTYSNGQTTTKTDGTYPVSANPGSGYVFDHWTTSGGVSVSSANSQSTTATVTGTGSIKAWFTQPMRTITFYTDPTAGGTITFAGSTYSNGQTTTKTDGADPVSANPPSGYVFDHWSTSGGVSVSNANSQSTTATVSGTGSIKAWFTTGPQHTITFYTDPPAGGTITFDGTTYSNGQSTTRPDGSYPLYANPAPNCLFDYWSTTGGVSVPNPNSQSTTVTVSGDGSINARLECYGQGVLYLDPSDSSAPYCDTKEVQIRVNTEDDGVWMNGGSIVLTYESGCADVTNVVFDPMWSVTAWDSETPGQETVGFLIPAEDLSPDNYLVATLTIHCVNDSLEGCITDLAFAEGTILTNVAGQEIYPELEHGTFECMPCTCGDTNCDVDHRVNIADASLLFSHVILGYPICCEGCAEWCGNVNCVGGVNIADASLLFSHVILGYPIECCPTELALKASSSSGSGELYLDPSDSSASYCDTAEVQIRVNTGDDGVWINGGSIVLTYESGCANVTNVVFDPMWSVKAWNSETPGQETLGFLIPAEDLSPDDYLVATLTIHCVNDSLDGCVTDLVFAEGTILTNIAGEEIYPQTEDGTFRCMAPFTLTVTSDGCCLIDVSYEGFSGEVLPYETELFEIPCGTNITLTADDSEEGCNFIEWAVDGEPVSGNPIDVTMDSDHTAIATCYGDGVTMVSIDAPDEVAEGSDFIANVTVDYVENYNSCGFDVTYDQSIITVTDVTDGEIDGHTVEVGPGDWTYIPPGPDPGKIRVIAQMGGMPGPGVTGTGYIAQIHYHVLGSVCNTSNIHLENLAMYDYQAKKIPTTTRDDMVTVGVSLVITTTGLPDGEVGNIYSATLEATGGVTPYTWEAPGLPAGLTCSGAGVISGTPVGEVGDFSVTVTVTGALGNTDEEVLSLTISCKLGDANMDGVVDTGDITKVKRIYFGIDPPTDCADINGDGKIDTGDITAIKIIYFS